MFDRRSLTERHVHGLIAVYELQHNPKTKFIAHYTTIDWLRQHGYIHHVALKVTNKGFTYLIENGLIRNNLIQMKARR